MSDRYQTLPPELKVTADGPLRTVTLNRPEHANAANVPMHRALAEVWRLLAGDAEAKVVIVTGAGKAFSAGGDFEFMQRLQTDIAYRQTVMEETRQILEAGKRSGLGLRAHIGQFADLGGAELLAELGARSVDHLEQVSDRGIAALSSAGVIAVMLPGACVQLRMAPPPVEKLRRAGVKMAVASDFNPGSTAGETLGVPMWLASTHYGMTVSEVWLGVTRHAAAVLGRADIGQLAAGKRADLVVWDASDPAEIPYLYGRNLAFRVIKDGQLISDL